MAALEALRIRGEVIETVRKIYAGKVYGVPHRFGPHGESGGLGIQGLPFHVPIRLGDDHELEVVDVFGDSRVFAVLDEGCSRTCHGRIWREGTEAKLKARGYDIGPLTPRRRVYSGLGRVESAGRRVFPWSMILVNGTHIRGSLTSNELVTPDNLPLMLSLNA